MKYTEILGIDVILGTFEAEKTVSDFRDHVKSEGFTLQKIMRWNWSLLENIPKSMSTIWEKNPLPEHKLMNNMLILMLCGNTRDDCEVKNFMVYYSETPKGFSRNNGIKSKIYMIW